MNTMIQPLIRLPLRARCLVYTLCCIGLLSAPADAEIAIIVNASNTQEIDLDTVVRIYLGQSAKFPSGDAAEPLAMPDGSKVRGELNLSLLQAAPASIKSAWARQQFTGGLKPLTTYNTEEAVLRAVAATPNAIGYVDAARVRGNVRVALKL
jgi:ABC-type phosphate transport system substrate-binding protein